MTTAVRFFFVTVLLGVTGAGCAKDDGDAPLDDAGSGDAATDVVEDAGDAGGSGDDVDFVDANEDIDASNDVDGSGDAGGGPLSTEAACRMVVAEICAGLFDCGCDVRTRPFDDEDECVTYYVTSCVEWTESDYGEPLQSGDMVWVRENLEACAAGVREQGCTFDNARGRPECLYRYADAAVIGEDCRAGRTDVACDGGMGRCSGDGVCTALAVEGEACGEAPCAVPFVCNDGACVTPGAIGAACGWNDACSLGLVCRGGSCATPGAEGDTCGFDGECGTGLRCADGACVAAGEAGTPCSSSSACGSGLICSADYDTRQCETGGGDGDPCSFEAPCGAGLFCDPSSTTCRALIAVGGACETTDQCVEGLLCVRDIEGNGRCTTPPGLGDACLQEADAFCAPGLGCNFDAGVCAAGGVDGEPCLINGLYGYACAEGFGCAFETDGSFCRPKGGEGASCTNDTTCADGTFCNYETLQCEAFRAAFSPCDAGNECGPSQTCARGFDGVFCRPLPADGETCDLECAAGLVCAGFGGVCAPSVCGVP